MKFQLEHTDKDLVVFVEERKNDYEQFYKIAKDMTRIENILKDLKQYRYEIEDYCF